MNLEQVEQLLRSAKLEYEQLIPTASMRTAGWSALKSEIDAQERRIVVRMRFVHYAILFATIVLVALAGTGGVAVASWRAQPGDFLYPMKTFSEEVLASVRHRGEEEQSNGPSETPTQTPEEEMSPSQEFSVGQDNIVKDTVKEAQDTREEDGKKGIGKDVKGAATSVVEFVKEYIEHIHQERD